MKEITRHGEHTFVILQQGNVAMLASLFRGELSEICPCCMYPEHQEAINAFVSSLLASGEVKTVFWPRHGGSLKGYKGLTPEHYSLPSAPADKTTIEELLRQSGIEEEKIGKFINHVADLGPERPRIIIS